MKDLILVFGAVMAIEVIDHAFGRAVGMAVCVTALIGIVIFLWHEGAKVIEARSDATTKIGAVEGESAVAESDLPNTNDHKDTL